MAPNSAAPGAGGSLRGLSATLVAGALYDFLLAAFFLFGPAVLADLFHLPLPGEAFYLRLVGVFLVILGLVYLAAARDPERHRPFVAIAVGARLLGFGALAASATGRPDLAGLWSPAFGDLAFGVAHLAAGRRLLMP